MSFEKSVDALYTIGEVASSLGIATHVLRFWEDKFKQIKPQKKRGRRYYTKKDIEIITKIKTYLYDKGLTIKGTQNILKKDNNIKISANDNIEELSIIHSNLCNLLDRIRNI